MRHNTRPINTPHWRDVVRPFVAKRASFRCEHCRAFVGMKGQADHIVPRAAGDLVGIHVYDVSNLQWLCASCHAKKSGSERSGPAATGPRPRRRTNVPGRAEYLRAAGIPTQTKHEEP